MAAGVGGAFERQLPGLRCLGDAAQWSRHYCADGFKDALGHAARAPLTAETMHQQIEAMKLAMSDTAEHVTEPSAMRVTTDELLSDEYAAKRRALIGEQALLPKAGDPRGGSTVYFCTADRDGMMVSFIQSNYRGFGSGIVIPGTGISMNDRMENFRFDPAHANCLEGGKRPYHTIIPGFLSKEGKAVGPFGIMGGFMQPQAHVQVVENLIDWHLNPQQALDSPRWQWIGGKRSISKPMYRPLKCLSSFAAGMKLP